MPLNATTQKLLRLANRVDASVFWHSSQTTTGNSSEIVSLFQNATAKHAPLPMAAPQLRRREAASTRAASAHTVARLSSETIRWYQMSSGLAPYSTTASAANGRLMSIRRARTYSRTPPARHATHISSRPTMTERASRANPSVSSAQAAIVAQPRNGWSQ